MVSAKWRSFCWKKAVIHLTLQPPRVEGLKHPWLTRKWNRFVQKPCEIPQEAFTFSHSGVSLFTLCSAAFLQISLHEFPQLMNTYVGRTGDPSHPRRRHRAWTDSSQHFITPRFTSLISPKSRTEPMCGEDEQSLRWHKGQRDKVISNLAKSNKHLFLPPIPPSSRKLIHPVCLLNGNVERSLLRQ